ncbi:MAG: hypothetical protein ACTJH9_05525 [Pseudoalteromonas sp.]|uniref:hypothetical protein n=1 Tax=unclassified Pseudoalteromonas TaxID=194690 RepID=UPI003F968AEF
MKAFIYLAVLALGMMTSGVDAKQKYKNKHTGKGSLPPGLQKKVANGGQLPPGWQKKYHRGDILDHDIYRYGKILTPIGRDNVITIEVDDTIIHLVHNTREILSILSRGK